jgi:hypothetical protein
MSRNEKNEWTTICRGFAEIQLSPDLSLAQWAERGRLFPGDYVFDRNRDTWVRAIDLPDVATVYRQRRMQSTIALILTLAATTCVVEPVLALLLVVAGN